jgi:Zn-dependent protease with chaperone function
VPAGLDDGVLELGDRDVPISDRIHFLDEQRRNRRRGARFSVFAIVAVALAGIPLCVVAAPLLFGVALVAAHLIDLVRPLSEAQWAWLHDIAFALPTIWRWMTGQAAAPPWGTLALVYVVPGALLMLVAWPFVKLLTSRAGAGTVLRRLPSRAPDPGVLAERQLVNVVQEMAVAAGVPAPTVRIIASPAVNAAAVGLTIDDAVLLVTTGFVERLDREQRQAAVAHLIGSIGNGDLEIAAVILSVFHTWGLVTLLLESPLDSRVRALLGRLVRLSALAVRGRADREEAAEVLEHLLSGAGWELEEFFRNIEAFEPRSALHGCYLVLIVVPMIATVGLATLAARQVIALFTLLVLGPWLSAMWRARRHLADATAVQLTRNPSALSGVVEVLRTAPVEVPGGHPVNFLFLDWPAVTPENAAQQTAAASYLVRMRLDPEVRLRRLAALGALLASGAPVRPSGLRARLSAALPDPKELGSFLGWLVLAVAVVGLLVAATLAAASLLLMALWYLLRWITAPLRWLIALVR